MEKKKYVFIVNENGKKQATFLIRRGKTEEELLEQAAKEYPNCRAFPGGESDFDQFASGKLYLNGSYIEEPPYIPSLESVQALKIAELKTIRNRKELEPIEYNGKVFDADKDSLDRLNYAIITLTVKKTDKINWTAADNTDIGMTVADLNAVLAEVGTRSNLLHIKYRELKARVLEASTNEEVESIIW